MTQEALRMALVEAAIKEALAQPEQEPVAWMCNPDQHGLYRPPTADRACKDCFPVFRERPQRTWVELTKGEIESWDLPVTPTVAEFAWFIKAKLKQKNG